MKILTANIAYGIPDMHLLFPSARSQFAIHGRALLMYAFGSLLIENVSSPAATQRRANYIRAHKNLENVFTLVARMQPDVLVFNEVIYELSKEEIEAMLQKEGFRTIVWGNSTHYPGTTLSTLLATKEPGMQIDCLMPQRPVVGGGAALAGIRLLHTPLSIFGMHLTYAAPKLFQTQLQAVATFAADEKESGNEVLLLGDWNVEEDKIYKNETFKKLNLISVDTGRTKTCPVFLPRFLQSSLDHVFVPAQWSVRDFQAISFGSDHLALLAEVDS